MTQSLLARAQSEGTPLIDGTTATFVWRGRHGVQLLGDFVDWEDGRAVALEEVEPEVWTAQLALPADAYVEYNFVRGSRVLPDPFNARSVPNGSGGRNRYFYMPGAQPSALAQRVRGVPHGTVTRHVLDTELLLATWTRPVYLYRPPVAGPVPLLVVLDGYDYYRRAALANQLDNLIAAGRIRPLAAALVHSGGNARMVEYGCAETTLTWVFQYLLPRARAELDLLDVERAPGAYGVLGASMGGLMATYMGLRAPEVFGHVLSQSGAFVWSGYDMIVFDLARRDPQPAPRFWLDVGRFESLLPANRRFRAVLAEQGYAADYHEYNGGHNYTAWRDDLARGLEFLFG